jgi:di/tricarboxylate transporter
MTPDAWLTLAVVAMMFVVLARELVSADVTIWGALTVLWVFGVVDESEALAGFSNSQVITVGMLFIVSAALRDTGALAIFTTLILNPARDGRRLLGRLLPIVATLSAFMNNTPLVAMFAPAVRDWALRNGRAPSKYLIPVSYAAILGGTATLIGTSTNLVVSGILAERGYGALGMFELSPVGIPATIVGVLFLLIAGPRLLPTRRTPDMSAGEASREYGVRLRVAADYPHLGRTVEEAGLRALGGLFLAEIVRGDERIVPVSPDDRVREGDVLVFFGMAESVVDLRRTLGLAAVDEEDAGGRTSDDRPLFEVVISANSPLIGQTLRDAGFRRRYDAAVIAIHRNGERLNQKLGDVELRPGDVLMVEASRGFRRAWGNSSDFYLVAQLEQGEKPRYQLAATAAIVLLAMVILMGTGRVSTALAASAAAIAMIGMRCVRATAARREIDLSVLAVIAGAIGISAAIENSGLAAVLADSVVGAVGVNSPLLVAAALYLVTAAATEMLSNNAAAALMMPIALSAAEAIGIASGQPAPIHAYAVVVAVAASLSFITPIGYQTNLMVYGPGGYRFGDFARVGAPLTVICFVVTMVVLALDWFPLPS